MRTGLHTTVGIVLAGLAMSVGWGIRGDYGHEAGAMIPGALAGLAICLASGREDWRRRASIVGMCGAVGWAFGGQMSYAQIVGYTAGSSLLDVSYGYACLFIIGGLWAGIGCAILALSLTRPASRLERFARPLVALWLVWVVLSLSGLTGWLSDRWSLNDTDWVGASSALLVAGLCARLFPSDRSACALIAVLAAGWGAGYLFLTGLLGLHMTPPRSDNWAGCIGLFVALLVYLRRERDRAALMAAWYGVLIGGFGFVVGDFVNVLGRAQWGPVGRYEILHGLDYWKWMEQLFGLIMGLGVGAVFLRRLGPRLSAPTEDVPKMRLRPLALFFLLVVMMWSNLSKNVTNWTRAHQIPAAVLGLGSTWWLLTLGVLLSAVAVVSITRHGHRRLALVPDAALGRAQLLFLLVLWGSVLGAFTQALPGMSAPGVLLVHLSFWVTAGLGSLLVVGLADTARRAVVEPCVALDPSWRPGRTFWVGLGLVGPLLLGIAWLTVASHREPLPGSQTRFPPPAGARP
jgi:hypothetical protein